MEGGGRGRRGGEGEGGGGGGEGEEGCDLWRETSCVGEGRWLQRRNGEDRGRVVMRVLPTCLASTAAVYSRPKLRSVWNEDMTLTTPITVN